MSRCLAHITQSQSVLTDGGEAEDSMENGMRHAACGSGSFGLLQLNDGWINAFAFELRLGVRLQCVARHMIV